MKGFDMVGKSAPPQPARHKKKPEHNVRRDYYTAAVSCGKKIVESELFLYMVTLKHMRKMKSTRILVFLDTGLLFSSFLVFSVPFCV